MAFSSSSSALSATPNVTPLIDVLLVLLIIFMVIVPIAPHGLESLLPQPSPALQAVEPSPLRLEILSPGRPDLRALYRLNGRDVTLPELRTLLRRAQSGSSQRSIFISGDPKLDYEPVVAAVSEAHLAGFRSIGLLTRGVPSGH